MHVRSVLIASTILITSATSAFVATPLRAQPPAAFAETPKSKKIDETYAEAMESAAKTFERARDKEVAAWIRSYERALSAAKASGDDVAVAYLSRAIALTKEAGYVIKPAPPDAKFYEGHGYLFLGEGVTFHLAKRRCEALGGHLVTVQSPGEAEFLVKTWGDKHFWVGAGDFAEEGDYRWIDGTPFDPHGYRSRFGNWRGFKHALSWSAQGQQWSDDTAESYTIGFVCEWDQ